MTIGSLATLAACLLLADPPGPRPGGTVVDASGGPVAGADVWLVGPRGPAGPSLFAATTDAAGRFAIADPPPPPSLARDRAWTFWAGKAGHRAARVTYPLGPPGGPVRLILGPPSASSFRVEGPDRMPIAGANVRVTRLDRDWLSIPEAMARKFEATTDASGRAVVESFLADEVSALEVRADGFGVQPRISSPTGPGPAVVRLRPTGHVAGRLVADDPAAARGWVVSAWTVADDGPPGRNSCAGSAEATTDREGRFEIPDLAAGKLSLSFTPPEGSTHRPGPIPDGTLAAGGGVEVEVALGKAVRVEGSVREKGNGAPVAGARVTVSTPSTPGRGDPIWADDRGRYAFHSLPGKVSASVTGMPAGYVQGLGLTLTEIKVPDGVDRHELPPIEAERGASVRGVVVDQAGRPVAGASVTGSWGMTDERGALSAVLGETTGPDGKFTLDGIHPGAEVAGLAARHRDLATAAPASARAGQGEEVTLRLAAGISSSLGGRVVEADGRPVPGARVTILHRTHRTDGTGSYGGSVRFDDPSEIRTGPDGSFRTPRELNVDVEYRAEAHAAGMLAAETGYLRPGLEGSSRFPDLVVRREVRERAIVGRVIDRRGRPVAGAEVFSSGDGPARAKVAADARGRFRLDGVAGDAVLVFARAPGFRPTGLVATLGAGPVDLTLAGIDEPPGLPGPPVAAVLTRADEKALAARLLEPLFPRILASGDEWSRSDALAALARSDGDRAIGLVQAQVVTADQRLVAEIALGLLDRDPAGATGSIRSVDDPDLASRAALDVFDARPEQAPAWRRGLLDLALARGREEDNREQRIYLLAEVADRLLALGAVELGTAVVREARALADGLTRGNFLHPRDTLAKPLARLDLAAALALIGPAKADNDNDRSLYGTAFRAVALRVAATDPAEAERLQHLMIIDEFGSPRSVVPLCGRMATADLPRARRLATSHDDPNLRAMALGAMAHSLAKADPGQARRLLDEAFAQLEGPSHANSDPAEAMAWLLPVAERIDPRIVPDYLWRCLSARSPTAGGATIEQVRSSAVVATLVGRHHPGAAAVVFAPVLDHLPSLIATSDDPPSQSLKAAISAAAAFDPRAIASIVEPAPGRTGPGPIGDAARVAAARMIALSPAERVRELARFSGVARPDDGFD